MVQSIISRVVARAELPQHPIASLCARLVSSDPRFNSKISNVHYEYVTALFRAVW